MELDWLQTFLAVVDRGGFTAASEHVHRSQSRVSAHIAGLEREVGVRLIDRSRRPARLTAAGEIFAHHAREILASMGSARSAVGALRGMEDGYLAVLTTPCAGAAFFPPVFAEVRERHPSVQLALIEQSWHDVEQRFLTEGVVVAVLPVLNHPLAPGLKERVLWQERFRAVVAADHEFAKASGPIRPADLVRQPLILTGTSTEVGPDVLRLLSARDVAAYPTVTVDAPQTLISLARSGVGVGIVNDVALQASRADGVVAVDIDEASMVREVAAYWYDVLVTTAVGRVLHRSVLSAPIPAGAAKPARSPRPLQGPYDETPDIG